MSKIGIIFCAYNIEEYIYSSLRDLVLARQDKLDGNEFYIAAISVPFKDFPITDCDNTVQILQKYKDDGLIDELITGPLHIKETEARTLALEKLIDNKCDIVWQYDGDEIMKLEQISKIIKFINANPFISCFKLSYKNFVFNENTYLVDPFCPMRIHRVKYNNYHVNYFWDDNNIMYGGAITRDLIRDIDFATLVIPKDYVWIDHFCWLDNTRSKLKYVYQSDRWGKDNCSFSVENNHLVFNDQYFARLNKPLPQIARL